MRSTCPILSNLHRCCTNKSRSRGSHPSAWANEAATKTSAAADRILNQDPDRAAVVTIFRRLETERAVPEIAIGVNSSKKDRLISPFPAGAGLVTTELGWVGSLRPGDTDTAWDFGQSKGCNRRLSEA